MSSTKYIFVTGGVVSSLGKGIAAASIGALLEARGFKVVLAKFDPYIAGPELTLADCAAFVHLPLVSLATKLAYGADALEGVAAIKPYLKRLGERSFCRHAACSSSLNT